MFDCRNLLTKIPMGRDQSGLCSQSLIAGSFMLNMSYWLIKVWLLKTGKFLFKGGFKHEYILFGFTRLSTLFTNVVMHGICEQYRLR